ncbi:MAG: RSP_2648 family PIN domain-containing protein [Pikeienuella sp.]|uniref:RSP_2648 family PIN domain-containing protein n=1 Tax=Pikeienuella sp. TaxID=2831957 RepID=UPI00391917F4
MILCLDACALYPVALREMLIAYAKAGGFTPVWSARAAEEWARAAGAKQGEAAEMLARGDAARMRAAFPDGEIDAAGDFEAGFGGPDPADAHVVAAALAGGAEAILTFNLKDFPPRALRPLGLVALHPDAFLAGALKRDPMRLRAALAEMERAAGERGMRAFLKRAGLPRFGRAWEIGS